MTRIVGLSFLLAASGCDLTQRVEALEAELELVHSSLKHADSKGGASRAELEQDLATLGPRIDQLEQGRTELSESIALVRHDVDDLAAALDASLAAVHTEHFGSSLVLPPVNDEVFELAATTVDFPADGMAYVVLNGRMRTWIGSRWVQLGIGRNGSAFSYSTIVGAADVNDQQDSFAVTGAFRVSAGSETFTASAMGTNFGGSPNVVVENITVLFVPKQL